MIICILHPFLEAEGVQLEKWSKGDWYIARKHYRTYILEVVYVINDLLQDNVVIKKEDVEQRILSIQQINPIFVKRVASEKYQKLRTVVRNMQKKFMAGKDENIGHADFLNAAKMHCRNTLI